MQFIRIRLWSFVSHQNSDSSPDRFGENADLDWLAEVDNVGEVVSPVTSQVQHQGHLKCRLL